MKILGADPQYQVFTDNALATAAEGCDVDDDARQAFVNDLLCGSKKVWDEVRFLSHPNLRHILPQPQRRHAMAASCAHCHGITIAAPLPRRSTRAASVALFRHNCPLLTTTHISLLTTTHI